MNRQRFLRRNTAFSANVKLPKPVVQEIIPTKVDKILLSLKSGEHIIVKSSHDPDILRIVKIHKDNRIITGYDLQFTDDTTKITAKEEITGILQIIFPQQTVFGELEIIKEQKTCSFKIPFDKLTSFIINGKERLAENIKNYSDLFKGLKFSINDDQITWPSNDTWSVNGSTDFEAEFIPIESKIIEWEVEGTWESSWVSLNGNKENKVFKGTWLEVVEKLLPDNWDYFSNGIIYPSDETFSFCMNGFLFSSREFIR